jgi:hypothetical protein
MKKQTFFAIVLLIIFMGCSNSLKVCTFEPTLHAAIDNICTIETTNDIELQNFKMIIPTEKENVSFQTKFGIKDICTFKIIIHSLIDRACNEETARDSLDVFLKQM